MNIDFNRIKADALRNEANATEANTIAAMQARLDALEAQNEDLEAQHEALRATKQGNVVRMKVSEKGGLSIYGMGRFPITHYQEQWLKLLAMSEEIKAFIKANAATLSTKD